MQDPKEELLGPAINAIKRLRPKPAVLRKIRGCMRTNPNGWEHYLLRALISDSDARGALLEHPICRRLEACMPRSQSELFL